MAAALSGHRPSALFGDFLAAAAAAISKPFHPGDGGRREEEYARVALKLGAGGEGHLARCLAGLVDDLGVLGPHDMLGSFYMAEKWGDAGAAQYFTPWEVSVLMARMSGIVDHVRSSKRGYITVAEPAAGSGRSVLALCRVLADEGIAYQDSLVVDATDIEPTAYAMTYIQLALLGVPAIVRHGNALSREAWQVSATPTYVLDGWTARLASDDDVDPIQPTGLIALKYPATREVRQLDLFTSAERTRVPGLPTQGILPPCAGAG